MHFIPQKTGRSFDRHAAALLAVCLVWVWSVYQSTLGMLGEGYENIFLTRTYEWLFYNILSMVCFALFFFLAKNAPKRLVAIAVVAVCTVTLTLQAMSPIGVSTDYYRYIWQGRLSNAGQDNYALVPWDAGVEKANVELFERMNWRDARSVYPPLAEQYFRIPAGIFDAEVLGAASFQTRLSVSKLPNMVLFLLCAFLLYKITNRKLVALAWLALPFLQFELVNSAHIDALSVMLLLSALYALKSRRFYAHVLAGSLIAAAGMVKLAPFVLIAPVAAYLYANYPLKHSLAAIGAFLAVTAAAMSPFILNDFALTRRVAFWLSGDEFSLGNPLYELASRLSGGYGVGLLKVILIGASVAVIVSIIRNAMRQKLSYDTMLGYSALLLLIPFIAAPIVLPWYWVAPLTIVFSILGLKNQCPTKAEILVLLVCVVLLLIQYIDRAIDISLEVRQLISILTSLALYAVVVVSMYKIYRSNKKHENHGLTKAEVK